MNEDFQKFVAYLQASDALLEQATKKEIAEVTRVLALHVGHYRTRYGDVPIEESIELLAAEKVPDEMARVLASWFGALVEMLKAMRAPEVEH